MDRAFVKEKIAERIAEIDQELKIHPERRSDLAWQKIWQNQPRQYPVLSLNRITDISAGEGKSAPHPFSSPEEHLLTKLDDLTRPLALLNPIAPILPTGLGPGTLATCFGLTVQAEAGYVPATSLSLAQALKQGMPDPEKSGWLPLIKQEILVARELTPSWMKIALPDTQGPFNLAHLILGNESFTAPFTQPEKFFSYLEIVTEFFVEVNKKFREWITAERLPEGKVDSVSIAECSVNLVSADFYRRFILPFDLRVAKNWKYVDIHTCSGPHVFQVTLDSFPNLVATEAGFIEKACAGWTPVELAVRLIQGRQIILRIGEELPADFNQAEEYVKKRLLLARNNHQLSFSFTGMYWKKTDEPAIRKLHRRLDDFWAKEVWPLACGGKN
ncbi:MAG: hypothetical protein NC911_00400 [Candidatus Omnitrophica bacterium]|nr:hypothetical protein [Candidatus Omnitrophota bacterium]